MNVWRATNKVSGEWRECCDLGVLLNSVRHSILFYGEADFTHWTFRGYNEKENAV